MIQGINKKIDEEKPWILAKEGKTNELKECLNNLTNELLNANYMLSPFIPETSERIFEVFSNEEIHPPKTPLFPKQ